MRVLKDLDYCKAPTIALCKTVSDGSISTACPMKPPGNFSKVTS